MVLRGARAMKRLAMAGLLLATLAGAILMLALVASAARSASTNEPPDLELDKWAGSQECETASIRLTVRGEGGPPGAVAGENVTATEWLPSNLHYVDGSAVPPPASVANWKLTWNLGTVFVGDVRQIEFDAVVDPPAGYVLADLYPDSYVSYDNYEATPTAVPFPETYVDVQPCVSSQVGGIAQLPDVSDSPGRNYVALCGLAAVALVALTAGAWYGGRRLG
jgi:hypothetical protein